MSNKLYTEEQVMNAIKLAHSHIKPLQYVVDTLTPIELPSDVEIKEFAKNLCDGNQHVLNCCLITGKMVIQKIQSKNVQ